MGDKRVVAQGGQGENSANARAHSEAWLLLPPDTVPERWSGRARAMSLLPLLPDEVDDLLEGRTIDPSIDEADEELSKLVVRGLTVSEIATQLQVSERTVERRQAALRERLGANSTRELALILARRSFQ